MMIGQRAIRAVAAIGLATALWAGAPVQAQNTIVSHGISTFGDLKYAADFPHLDYVNPEAPDRKSVV